MHDRAREFSKMWKANETAVVQKACYVGQEYKFLAYSSYNRILMIENGVLGFG